MSAMSAGGSAGIPLMERQGLAEDLHRLGAVQFGRFTLKNGSTSPVYCDLRLMIGDPAVLRRAARCYAAVLGRLEFDRIAGIPHAGLPIATAVSLLLEKPMIFPRRQVKDYGAARSVEGPFAAGETAVVIDDLISSGASKLEAIEPLEAVGLLVRDIVVLVDRRPAGATDVEDAGYRVHAAFHLRDIAHDLADSGRMNAEELAAIEAYLAG
jgi:uridine monophosphate synthetase